MFPLFFAALFLSSMALPRDLIETDWFRTVATWNPVSYMLEAIRSLVIIGWDPEALALGFACAGGVALIALVAASSALRTQDGAHVSRGGFWSVARAVAWRNVHNFFTNPAMIVPGAAVPAVLLHRVRRRALARGLRSPASTTAPTTPTFVYGFVLLQASTFGGVFTGFSVARDFESGFSRRLMLGAPQPRRHRRRLLAGRARARDFTVTVITTVALIAGLERGAATGRPRRPLHARRCS